jgi:ATP-binding cassette, subfamily C, bacterial CydC
MRRLARLLSLTGASRSRTALAVALGALTVLFGVGLMATAGYLISRAAQRPAILSLTVAIVAVRFFGIGRPLVRYLDRLASHDLALRALGTVRVRAYERIEPLAPAELGGRREGDLLTSVVADVDALQGLHLQGVLPPLVALLAGAASVGVAAAFLPAAGLVLALGLLAGAIAVPLLSAGLYRRAARRQAGARAELSAEVLELLACAPELAVYGLREERLAGLRAVDSRLVRLAARDALSAGVAEGAGLLMCGLTVVGVLASAVAAHADGRLGATSIALLALLALASFEAVQPLALAARELAATLASGARLLELMDREPSIADPPAPAAPPQSFELRLEGVWARYGAGERPVLEGLDLRLPAGGKLALVGASGAGKSTIVDLLLRFLDPERGRVTLGGRDLREYRQRDVRAAIALAGQDSHLFSASIRENLLLAAPDASDAELERALRRACSWGWVSALPQGIGTLVGEQGRALSGGQRQRLALARALLADAPVLVLDEPTAHLDAPTAAELMRDVFAAAAGRSVLLITHRPEGLELVDEVLELADGRARRAAV